jgi:hypothetical protein
MVGPEPNGVIAIYPDEWAGHGALQALFRSGIDPRKVSVLGPHPRARAAVPPELDRGVRHAIDVATYWAEWGGVIGAGVGTALITIPLIAAVVGLGTFATTLAAIPVATTAGGALATAFVGLGVHEAHALRYEHALRDGKLVVVVHDDDPAVLEDLRATLAQGAERVDTHGLRSPHA